MKVFSTLILFLAIASCYMSTSCSTHGISGTQLSADTLDRILVNQVGYPPEASKIALLRIKTAKFEIVDVNNGKVVYTGKPGIFKYWDQS